MTNINKVKLAIVEDEKVIRDLYLKFIDEWFISKKIKYEVELFESAESFLFSYEDGNDYDFLILDYELKNLNGKDLAKIIRKYDKEVNILFISGYSEYIGIGYEVDAINYLIKPIDKNKLFEIFDKIIIKIENSEKSFIIKTTDGNKKLFLDKIFCILSDKNYIDIYYNNETVKTRMTMKQAEDLLDNRFHKIDRSTIINIEKIDSLKRNEVILENGLNLLIARGKFDEINKKFIEYF